MGEATAAERKTTRPAAGALGADFFKLLDELTIARSRKHIQKYYKQSTWRNSGGFPNRLKPSSVFIRPSICRAASSPIDTLERRDRRLSSSALFNPSNVRARDAYKPEYEEKSIGIFTQAAARGLPHRHDEGELPQAPGKLGAFIRASPWSAPSPRSTTLERRHRKHSRSIQTQSGC
ncbi:MAG: hypothetical protein MZV65_36235 [Chromatiales bacterium]|nr:hypothetical protein [Chromatiales bacterium]